MLTANSGKKRQMPVSYGGNCRQLFGSECDQLRQIHCRHLPLFAASSGWRSSLTDSLGDGVSKKSSTRMLPYSVLLVFRPTSLCATFSPIMRAPLRLATMSPCLCGLEILLGPWTAFVQGAMSDYGHENKKTMEDSADS